MFVALHCSDIRLSEMGSAKDANNYVLMLLIVRLIERACVKKNSLKTKRTWHLSSGDKMSNVPNKSDFSLYTYPYGWAIASKHHQETSSITLFI
jgi:hypothetical protein